MPLLIREERVRNEMMMQVDPSGVAPGLGLPITANDASSGENHPRAEEMLPRMLSGPMLDIM